MNNVVRNYLNCYEKLNMPNLEKMMEMVDEDIFFCDPFHTFKGRKKLGTLLKKFIKKFGEINFKILKVMSIEKHYLVKWKLLTLYRGKKIEFNGISELIIRKNLIVSHIDYWDSGRNFYAKLPLIGKIFQTIHN